jgi:antitoxin HicB
MMTLEEYMELPYTIEITRDRDDQGTEGYVAQIKELPGCMSQGATIEEAVTSIQDAMAGWLSVALQDGVEIPEPREFASFSGRFLLRLPRGLHAELSRQAEDEGTSLNQYVLALLAGAAHWRARDSVA